MSPWNTALREAAVSGSLASLLSAAALVCAGRREVHDASAPVNAPSHWLWGGEALAQRGSDWRHTANGYLIHHLAASFWAVLHARALRGHPAAARPAPALAAAAVTATLACAVDMRLVPHRLSPGFQHQLSRPALAVVYACFALGLAGGSLAMRRR